MDLYKVTELYIHYQQVYPHGYDMAISVKKRMWDEGGTDPLDQTLIYSHPGDLIHGILPHWHYVSLGLSDLHNHSLSYPSITSRVYPEYDGLEKISGFGFELTFRLMKHDDVSPPVWPVTVMQSLARYVYRTKNIFHAGDHVSWLCKLDNTDSTSKIHHLLLTQDAQLKQATTNNGRINFIQIVGLFDEEYLAARQWNGTGVLELMTSTPGAGGLYLVTDMHRDKSIFDLIPYAQDAIEDGILVDGSDLKVLTSESRWSEKKSSWLVKTSNSSDSDSDTDFEHVGPSEKNPDSILGDSSSRYNYHSSTKHTNTCGSRNSSRSSSGTSFVPKASTMAFSHGLTEKDRSQSVISHLSEVGVEAGELDVIRHLTSLHLYFNLEAGLLLPLVFKGRLKHNRHFTYKNIASQSAITFVVKDTHGTAVTEEEPFAIHGSWLQVLITTPMIKRIYQDLEELERPTDINFPKTYEWPDYKMTITVDQFIKLDDIK